MRAQPWLGILVAILTVVAAGCGMVTRVERVSSATPSGQTPAAPHGAARDPTTSDRYCQRLPTTGRWVTNTSAYSTTPCVPDPAYATGDESADAAKVVPRCRTCTLADWRRAEARKAPRRSGRSNAKTAPAASGAYQWSPGTHSYVFHTCTSRWGGSTEVCQCAVTELSEEVDVDEATSLSADDPRVRAAAGACATEASSP
jgi:hypothetical protein